MVATILAAGLPAATALTPVLSGGGPEVGWARGTVEAQNASEMRFVLRADDPRDETALVLRIEFLDFDANGTFSFISDNGETVVQSDIAGLNVRTDYSSSLFSGMVFTVQVSCDRCIDGEVRFLVLAAGSASRWAWSLEGDVSAWITAIGDRGTFLHDLSEFSGMATVMAPVYSGGTIGGAIPVRTAGTIWALFNPSQAGIASVLTPDGEKACACVVGGLRDGSRAGPGEYVFRIHGADVAHHFALHTYLFGAVMEQ